jgi:hypothetical protein
MCKRYAAISQTNQKRLESVPENPALPSSRLAPGSIPARLIRRGIVDMSELLDRPIRRGVPEPGKERSMDCG